VADGQLELARSALGVASSTELSQADGRVAGEARGRLKMADMGGEQAALDSSLAEALKTAMVTRVARARGLCFMHSGGRGRPPYASVGINLLRNSGGAPRVWSRHRQPGEWATLHESSH